jgi:hypothetical protein
MGRNRKLAFRCGDDNDSQLSCQQTRQIQYIRQKSSASESKERNQHS